MNFKREPALLLMSLAAPLAQLILILIPVDPGTQQILGGCVPAIAGLIVAILVRSEGLVAAILGFAQSALAAVIAYGLPLTVDQQSAIMGFVALAAGLVIRDRVMAPVPETVSDHV